VSILQQAVWLSVEEAFVIWFDWQEERKMKVAALKNLT